MIDTNRTFVYKEPVDITRNCYMLIVSLANMNARYVKIDQL